MRRTKWLSLFAVVALLAVQAQVAHAGDVAWPGAPPDPGESARRAESAERHHRMKIAGIVLTAIGILGVAATIGVAAAASSEASRNDPNSDSPPVLAFGACLAGALTVPFLVSGIALWVSGADHSQAPIKNVSLNIIPINSPVDSTGQARISGGVVSLALTF